MIKYGLKIIRSYNQGKVSTLIYDYFLFKSKKFLVEKSEGLFTIIHNIDLLTEILQNPNSLEQILCHNDLKDYFKFLIREITITEEDIINLREIKDLCYKLLKNPYYNSIVLTSFFKKFNRIDLLEELDNLQLYSEYGFASIPYHSNLYNTIKNLNYAKQDYSVYTLHNAETFTDICLICLYECINLHYRIRQCVNCKSLFFGTSNECLCNQKNATNNLVGCKKLMLHIRATEYPHLSDINRRKVKIYNRLYRRTKRFPDDKVNIQNLKKFSDGWKERMRFSRQLPEENQYAYLNTFLDKWDIL